MAAVRFATNLIKLDFFSCVLCVCLVQSVAQYWISWNYRTYLCNAGTSQYVGTVREVKEGEFGGQVNPKVR